MVLLHGGLSRSSSMLRSVGARLKRHFVIAAFDRRGHGRTPDTDAPFSYDAMAHETIAFIELLQRRVDLVGYSDGGIVAILVGLLRPDLICRIVAVGANYHYEGLVAVPSTGTDSASFVEWAEKYASESPDGIGHAADVWAKGNELFQREPNLKLSDLKGLQVPTLIMSGDDDLVSLTHTISMYQAIPESQLAVMPGASHALLSERPKMAARIIRRFLTQRLPVQTFMPVRRRSSI